MDIIRILTDEFQVREEQVRNVVELLDEGNTVPFIARYRKEKHGSLDDQTIRRIALRLQALRNLVERKEEVRTAIENKGAMTEEITKALDAAMTMVEVEDIYRPYKEKRRTRGSVAREKGLTPLAELILEQREDVDPEQAAEAFISEEKEVPDVRTALQGAMDIIAENISDNAQIRTKMRDLYQRFGTLTCVAADEEAAEGVYKNYAEFECLVPRLQGHQILAVNRGEKEEALKVNITVGEGLAEQTCCNPYVKNQSKCGELVRLAAVKIHYFKLTVQAVKVLVITVDKDRCKGLFVKPIQPILLRVAHAVAIPDRAEIAADNHNVVLCHLLLLRKSRGGELLKFTMAVACYKNHIIITPNFFNYSIALLSVLYFHKSACVILHYTPFYMVVKSLN